MEDPTASETEPSPSSDPKRARRPQSSTIGSPEGLHLPGILPEPDLIEASAETELDRQILADIAEGMDESDLDPDRPAAPPRQQEAVPDPATWLEQGPKPRAQYPWWYATFTLTVVGLVLLGFGGVALGRVWPLGLLLMAIGALALVGAVRSVVNRPRLG